MMQFQPKFGANMLDVILRRAGRAYSPDQTDRRLSGKIDSLGKFVLEDARFELGTAVKALEDLFFDLLETPPDR
jgi:hypothetical protein